MTDERTELDVPVQDQSGVELTTEELEAQAAELPDREARSVINSNL